MKESEKSEIIWNLRLPKNIGLPYQQHLVSELTAAKLVTNIRHDASNRLISFRTNGLTATEANQIEGLFSSLGYALNFKLNGHWHHLGENAETNRPLQNGLELYQGLRSTELVAV